MLKHQPKTMAKTLDYIARHAPAEFGLFWDQDGTMPWKEFYWALQEDPSLRFVREAAVRELALLGIALPFTLDGRILRLSPDVGPPDYRRADAAPERLYYGIRPRNLARVRDFGIKSPNRPLVPLSTTRELALRIAKRRESEPIIVEIEARRAVEEGITLLVAGPELYLVESVPASFLIIPKIRQDLAERLIAERAPKPASSPKPAAPPSPGSFIVQPHHMGLAQPGKSAGKPGKKGKGGWKKDSRSERRKREA